MRMLVKLSKAKACVGLATAVAGLHISTHPLPEPMHDFGLDSVMVQQVLMHVNVLCLCATVPMSTQTKPLHHPQCQHRQNGEKPGLCSAGPWRQQGWHQGVLVTRAQLPC